MLRNFWNDESGFIVSAELVLVATIVVIGLLVGLVEVQWGVVGELNDVGDAIGSLNQSFQFCGFSVVKTQGTAARIKALNVASVRSSSTLAMTVTITSARSVAISRFPNFPNAQVSRSSFGSQGRQTTEREMPPNSDKPGEH